MSPVIDAPSNTVPFDPLAAELATAALHAHGSATADAVADAFAKLRDDPGPDELAWAARIEELRAALEASEEPLTIQDYGAGGKDDLFSAEEMRAGRTITKTVGLTAQASKAYTWALLLHLLVRRLRPHTCLELGTCLGVSSAYQAAALELNGEGRLVTLEGAASLADLARENLAGLGLDRVEVRTGRFHDTLGPVLEEYAPIDFAFVDGHHDEDATLAYFERLLPCLSPGAVLVFDDISWSPGMERAWTKVTGHERVRLVVDFDVIGLCALGPAAESKLVVRAPLKRSKAPRLALVRRRLRGVARALGT